jgi:hypothetical protein
VNRQPRGKSRLSLLWDAGDLEAVEDELEELLGPDDQERNVIDSMLQAGRHPKAIVNKIEYDRR